jgi:hypothetical protein
MFFHQTADWGAARNSITVDAAGDYAAKDDAAEDDAAKDDSAGDDAKYTELRRMNPPIREPQEPRDSGDLGHGSDGGNNQKPMLAYGGNAKDGVTVPNEDDDEKRCVPVSEDWRWQPVFGQIMVLVLTGFYCVYISDVHRTEFNLSASFLEWLWCFASGLSSSLAPFCSDQ